MAIENTGTTSFDNPSSTGSGAGAGAAQRSTPGSESGGREAREGRDGNQGKEGRSGRRGRQGRSQEGQSEGGEEQGGEQSMGRIRDLLMRAQDMMRERPVVAIGIGLVLGIAVRSLFAIGRSK
jgi:ElaB/YqjD/DUF883 family membrane-anchored ribosome-binding protein